MMKKFFVAVCCTMLLSGSWLVAQDDVQIAAPVAPTEEVAVAAEQAVETVAQEAAPVEIVESGQILGSVVQGDLGVAPVYAHTAVECGPECGTVTSAPIGIAVAQDPCCGPAPFAADPCCGPAPVADPCCCKPRQRPVRTALSNIRSRRCCRACCR